VEEKLNIFMRSFKTLMYYLRGLHAGVVVMQKLMQHSFSQQCRTSLMKLDRCSACAGYASLRPCKSLCVNLLRGCLVDLADMEQPVLALSQALADMNEYFANVDFHQRLISFEQFIFDFIGSTALKAPSIANDVSTMRAAAFSIFIDRCNIAHLHILQYSCYSNFHPLFFPCR